MDDRTDIAEIPIIGASIPRSGHHHLSRLMTRYFGGALKYCSMYDVAGCCRASPCTAPAGRRIVFQKSHDFAFRLRADIPGALYVIQHRHPVPNAISDAELRAKRSGFQPASAGLSARSRFYSFLAYRLAYYKRFHDKWIVAPPARSVTLGHGALEQDPAAALRAIAAAAGEEVDEAKIARAAEALKDQGSRKTAYAPRVVERSAFFERGALAAYEAAVIEHCPAFGYEPTLGGSRYRVHPIWAIARLRYGFGRALPPGRDREFE